MFPPFLPMAAAGGYYFFAVPARSTPRGSASRTRNDPGKFRVVRDRYRFVDDSRPTQAYKKFPGSPQRVLNADIWRPENPGRAGPLLVYSHGFMSFRLEGLYLVRFLASHGYTVVAVDYPLTGAAAPDRPLVEDIVNQPGDIRHVIDTMLERNETPGDAIHGTIDPQKIAVAGVSLGGLTSLLATYHRGLRDPRISAAICIGGPTSMLSAKFFAGNDVPLLMVYGDADSLVLYEEHAPPALERIPDATLVTLKNGSHTGFAQPASTALRLLKNPDSFACRAVRWGRGNSGTRWDFVTALGGAQFGIAEGVDSEVRASPLVRVAMKAARQQMFTRLASHAFLDTVFARDERARRTARRYLFEELPGENGREVSVMH